MNCEDLYTDRQWRVCHAFATFVARRTEAGKVGQTAKIGKVFFCYCSIFCVYTCVCVCARAGTTETSDPSHTNGTDGVQPGGRTEEDEAHPC